MYLNYLLSHCLVISFSAYPSQHTRPLTLKKKIVSEMIEYEIQTQYNLKYYFCKVPTHYILGFL